MIIITKKRLNKILEELEYDSADQSKADGITPKERLNAFYWRCGNANAVNFIRYKLGIKKQIPKEEAREVNCG